MAAAAAAAATLGKSSVARGGGRDEVYVAAVALRATRGPAQLIMSAAYTLSLWDLQHFMVLIKPSSSHPHPQIHVFDFQPVDPENISVALAALSGRSVAGSIFKRKLKRLPRERCWLVGSSQADALEAAIEFNESWKTDLRIGHHDCRDYTNGLVEYLTGERSVLDHLKSNGR